VLHHLVQLGISPWEKAVRTAAVYAAILGLLHLSGKRSLAQLNCATFMSPRLARMLQGSATTVTEDGTIDDAALTRLNEIDAKLASR